MYVTDINTTYAALKTRAINVTENGPIKLNGENLEFSVTTNEGEDRFKSDKKELGTVFPEQLSTKGSNETLPTFKFPQFIKVREGKGEVKVYELVSFVNNNTSGFTNKNDQFLNYIDATGEGVNHNVENAYAAGEKATYKPLDIIGQKGVSVFFPGTYDLAKAEFNKVTPKQVDAITTVEVPKTELTTLEQLAQDLGTNVVDVKLAESIQIPVKFEEKVVSLDPSVQLGKQFTLDTMKANGETLKNKANLSELVSLKEDYANIRTKEDVKALNIKIQEILDRPDSPLNNKC